MFSMLNVVPLFRRSIHCIECYIFHCQQCEFVQFTYYASLVFLWFFFSEQIIYVSIQHEAILMSKLLWHVVIVIISQPALMTRNPSIPQDLEMSSEDNGLNVYILIFFNVFYLTWLFEFWQIWTECRLIFNIL
jgi:hypothetical protein